MRWWMFIHGLLFTGLLPAQDTCSCAQNLEGFIGKVERNYAGFQDKVNEATRPRYQALVDSVKRLAANEQNKSRCFQLLEAYRTFFRDKHLQLSGTHAPKPDGTLPTPPRITAWTATELERYFAEAPRPTHPLEGPWSLEAYRVGLVHNDSLNAYEAIIMASQNPNWKEGMVKFTVTVPGDGRCTVQYWRGDLKMQGTTAVHVPGHLAMKGIGTWHQIIPPAGALSATAFELTYGPEVQWRMLNDSTLYIKLGSCDLRNKAVLDSLVGANKDLLDQVPNWIVDFRGNGGGSTDVFQSLLPYLYTRPMKDYGADHWMSPENTALLKEWLEANRSMVGRGTAHRIQRWIEHGEDHPNTWHKGSGGTLRLKRTGPMPRRVAILADRGTASSGESFVFIARGISAKAVIFGGNTGGYMDYGDLQDHQLGCDGLVTSIPSARFNRIDHGMRYDLDGIPPDVRISDPDADWIEVVQRTWAGQP